KVLELIALDAWAPLLRATVIHPAQFITATAQHPTVVGARSQDAKLHLKLVWKPFFVSIYPGQIVAIREIKDTVARLRPALVGVIPHDGNVGVDATVLFQYLRGLVSAAVIHDQETQFTLLPRLVHHGRDAASEIVRVVVDRQADRQCRHSNSLDSCAARSGERHII